MTVGLAISASALALLGAPARPSESCGGFLEADFATLELLASRDRSGNFVVPDFEVLELEQRIAHHLSLLPGWSISLRPEQAPQPPALGLEVVDGFTRLNALLEGERVRQARLALSLEGGWANVAGLEVIDPTSSDPLARSRSRSGAGFFPWRAIPVLLGVLSEIAESPHLGGIDVRSPVFEDQQPLLPRPSALLHVVLQDREESCTLDAMVEGRIELPLDSAQPDGFVFESDPDYRERVPGPRAPAKSFQTCLLETMLAHDALLPDEGWTAVVRQHPPTGTSRTWIWHREREGDDKSRNPLLWAESSGCVGDPSADTFRTRVAGVEVSAAGARAFADALAREIDPESEDLMAVVGCAELKHIDLIITARTAQVSWPDQGRAVRLRFNLYGESVGARKFMDVRHISARDDGSHRLWRFVYSDGLASEVRVHFPVFCLNDADITSYASFEGRAGLCAGGTIESRWNRR